MLKISLKDQYNQPIIGRIDHDKETGPFEARGEEMAVLAIKDYRYQLGDKVVVTTEANESYFVVQLDETLAPNLIYLPEEKWEYHFPLEESFTKSSVETGFQSARHQLMIRKAYEFEITNYQNLSINTHDQKNDSGAYPHAFANVETRNDSVFFAKNAIDGKYGNLSHGSYPFASWGINQQADAELVIDFGRVIETDRVQVLFRGDYPHDSFWTEITLLFSDGETLVVPTTNTLSFQEITFPMKKTSKLTIKNLKKANDDSPFPALTQIEVFGRNSHE
ncbi:hypothetical protein [Enterococcus thailandicus]|uniref:hypothetical protein n=1 Tax=Enterococcus thailandicus TaxID=417368 RepID=UPI0022EBC600|nr:hypothetical protein [Enterococcus thailandicus]MDA3965056.1 hypothetical protein [Enterococcus thailandicus]